MPNGGVKSAPRRGRKTGPRTPGGKSRSSQNALKHGLARELSYRAHPLFGQIVDTLRRETGVSSPVAEEVAIAELTLRRVTSAELYVLSSLNGMASDAKVARVVTALIALNRYETRARSQMRRAITALRAHQLGRGTPDQGV